MMQQNMSGDVALRLLDEIVLILERRKLLPPHDIEGIVATLTAEADRFGYTDHGNVARCSADRALGWLLPPE